jgi:putative ABC transport system permease protein
MLPGVFVLGLGVGWAIGIATLFEATLSRRMPYSETSRLIAIVEPHGNSAVLWRSSLRDVKLWSEYSRTLSSVSYLRPARVVIDVAGNPEQVYGAEVSPNIMRTLGVAPSIGRGFVASDLTSATNVAIISDRLWKSHFGGRKDVSSIQWKINDASYTVIGVMSPDFELPANSRSELWLIDKPQVMELQSTDSTVLAMARMDRGVNQKDVEGELLKILQSSAASFPNGLPRVRALSLRNYVLGDAVQNMWWSMALTAVFFLTACVNGSVFLSLQVLKERQERAILNALGVHPYQIVLDLFIRATWTLTYSCLLGAALIPPILALLKHELIITSTQSGPMRVDVRVLSLVSMALALSFVFVMSFPTIEAFRRGAWEELKNGSIRAQTQGGSVRKVALGSQVAGSTLLLSIALLLSVHVRGLYKASPGFDTSQTSTAALYFPLGEKPRENIVLTLYKPIIDQIGRAEGVVDVAISSHVPLSVGMDINGRYGITNPEFGDVHEVEFNVYIVSEAYFSTLQIPIIRGRSCNSALDRPETIPHMIVSESFAKSYLPNIGYEDSRLVMADNPPWSRAAIVGVVGDVRNNSMLELPQPDVYVCQSQVSPQSPFYELMGVAAQIVVRTGKAGNDDLLRQALQTALKRTAPQVLLGEVMNMQDLVERSLGSQAIAAEIVMVVALLTSALAILGCYALSLHFVEQRRRDIAIRMALGASSREIVLLVIRNAAWVALLGVGGGVALLIVTVLAARHEIASFGKDWILAGGGSAILMFALTLASALLTVRSAISTSPASCLRE